MPVSDEYLAYVIDQLKEFGTIAARRMFGGAGLYHRGVFFGLVADDVVYFKTDDANRQDYVRAGMEPFKPFDTYAMGYYEVPGEVLEDPDTLARWAGKALHAAGRKKEKKKPGKRTSA